MKDQFRGYDRWKLSNREDEEDAANARHRRELAREERADEDRDREKDENQRWAEIENAMLHGGD